MAKKKKTVRLRDVLIFDALILAVIGVILFVIETRVTEETQRENLIKRLTSITNTFTKSYQETQEITQLYDQAMNSKAQSLAFRIDNDEDFEVNGDIVTLYQVDDIVVGDIPRQVTGFRHYSAETADGRYVTIRKNSAELDGILNNIYTDNKVLQRVVTLDDMFFIVTNSSGNIVYFPEEEFIGQHISSLGISLNDLPENDARWLKINRKYYYTSSAINNALNITISCGIKSNSMTTNSHIAVGILYTVICIVFTIVMTYSYFSKQEELHRNNSDDINNTVAARKLSVFCIVALMLIGLTTYYIQTLFSLSMYSISLNNEIGEITANVAEGKNASEQLRKQYDASYLNKAQIVSDLLADNPQLQTRENLQTLSDIMDFEYIMLYNSNGEETLSNSYIRGFVISDNPEDQSYVFRQLMYGIPYIIQDPMEDELTGTYHQFIGVTMLNNENESDGFLQVAINTSKLDMVLEEVSLDKILDNSISGTGDDIVAIDQSTGKISYSSIEGFTGVKAEDVGFTEDEIKNRYFGYINLEGTEYYANSVEIENQLVYIIENSRNLFSGRLVITVISQILCIINMILFTIYINRHQVEPLIDFNDEQYIDVTTGSGNTKRTLNIVSRIMRKNVRWNDRTPEEKTGFIMRVVVSFFAVVFIMAILFRNVLYTEDTIFGFIVSNKWEKGFNVFALTEAIIAIFGYTLFNNIFNLITDEIIKIVSPKNETLVRLIKSFVHYVGVIILLYYCLSLFGFDSQALLASAGLLTLVVGLGAKDLITDILAGIFIIFENEFQVGDYIELNGYKGRVIEIGIRTTRIVNSAQDVKSINNRNLSNIVNKTKRNSYCDVIINVGFDQDIKKIEQLLNEHLPEIAKKSPYIISGPSYGGIDDMSGRFMRLSIRTECLENYKFEVRTVVNREIKLLFDENGIKLS